MDEWCKDRTCLVNPATAIGGYLKSLDFFMKYVIITRFWLRLWQLAIDLSFQRTGRKPLPAKHAISNEKGGSELKMMTNTVAPSRRRATGIEEEQRRAGGGNS